MMNNVMMIGTGVSLDQRSQPQRKTQRFAGEEPDYLQQAKDLVEQGKKALMEEVFYNSEQATITGLDVLKALRTAEFSAIKNPLRWPEYLLFSSFKALQGDGFSNLVSPNQLVRALVNYKTTEKEAQQIKEAAVKALMKMRPYNLVECGNPDLLKDNHHLHSLPWRTRAMGQQLLEKMAKQLTQQPKETPEIRRLRIQFEERLAAMEQHFQTQIEALKAQLAALTQPQAPVEAQTVPQTETMAEPVVEQPVQAEAAEQNPQ